RTRSSSSTWPTTSSSSTAATSSSKARRPSSPGRASTCASTWASIDRRIQRDRRERRSSVVRLTVEFPSVSYREGPEGVMKLARALEQIGYDHIDMFDHVVMGYPLEGRPPGPYPAQM